MHSGAWLRQYGAGATRRKWHDVLRTITIYGAMGARLLAIAFDFLSSALVACSRDSAALLRGRTWLLRLVGVIFVGRRWLLGGVWSLVHLGDFPLTPLEGTGAIVYVFGRRGVHSLARRSMEAG